MGRLEKGTTYHAHESFLLIKLVPLTPVLVFKRFALLQMQDLGAVYS